MVKAVKLMTVGSKAGDVAMMRVKMVIVMMMATRLEMLVTTVVMMVTMVMVGNSPTCILVVYFSLCVNCGLPVLGSFWARSGKICALKDNQSCPLGIPKF